MWRTWQSRFPGVPLVLLLVISGSAFLLGLFSSIFLREVFQLSASGPERNADARLSLLPVDFVRFPDNCLTEWEEVPRDRVRSFILDSVFDGISPFDGFPSNETVPLLRKHRIKGWGANATVFGRLMREVRPTLIVELGSFLGASAMHMGQIARNLSLETVILCLDDFRGWPGFRETKFKDIKIHNGENLLYHQFLKNIQFMNLTDLILPVPYSTAATLLAFCEWGIRPDLIEVDAAHDFHSTWIDLNLGYAILKPGGVMFGHDYFNRGKGEGVRRAVDIFARLKNLKVEPDGQHWILRNSSYVLPGEATHSLRSGQRKLQIL
ncbi:unnamed protein product [Calypogeia fissa]